tara:strand:- start:9492 stop:9857 length:366 start_codon:yes stop_codon:yes gene_type:complete
MYLSAERGDFVQFTHDQGGPWNTTDIYQVHKAYTIHGGKRIILKDKWGGVLDCDPRIIRKNGVMFKEGQHFTVLPGYGHSTNLVCQVKEQKGQPDKDGNPRGADSVSYRNAEGKVCYSIVN